MAGKKRRRLRKPVKVILVILLALLVAGVYSGFRSLQRKQALHETEDNLIAIGQKSAEAAAGEPFDLKTLFPEGVEVTVNKDIDTSIIGMQTASVTLSSTDAYGDTATRDVEVQVEVKDLTPPVISFASDSVTIYSGVEISAEDNIVSVTDETDGNLKKADVLSTDTYTIDSDVDSNTPGDYTVTVKAMDSNGNTSEKSYGVTVKEMVAYPYYIRVNRAANTVTVYQQDDNGEYTIPCKAFVCSTGDATPLGIYQTGEKYRWRALFGNVYGQYATRITGNILFHSVPYYSPDPSNLESEEYNKLGTAASMGCIRLCVRDVLWIYNNCPSGTTVEFYDDAENPGPLGKPDPITIDLSSPNAGWDPTDPDPANPWNN